MEIGNKLREAELFIVEPTLVSLGFNVLHLCLLSVTGLPHFYGFVSAITYQALTKGCNLHLL